MQNALKLTYCDFKIFPGEKPPDPRFMGKAASGEGASNAGRGGEGEGRGREGGRGTNNVPPIFGMKFTPMLIAASY